MITRSKAKDFKGLQIICCTTAPYTNMYMFSNQPIKPTNKQHLDPDLGPYTGLIYGYKVWPALTIRFMFSENPIRLVTEEYNINHKNMARYIKHSSRGLQCVIYATKALPSLPRPLLM